MTDKAPEIAACPIALAITEHWGERCPDFEQGCPCCDAWAEYDRLTADLHVKVKPLVWEGYWASSPYGPYSVWKGFENEKGAWCVSWSGTIVAHAHTLDEAEAAAQADYERRILAALEPAPMTPAQNAKVLLREIMNVEEHDVWCAAQDEMDKGGIVDASDIVIAALRAIAEGESE